jgi:tetratricopeptide (TPR) repeat protein
MMTFISIISFAVLFCGSLYCQTDLEYANDLVRQKDFYRAISEYKRILFFSNNNNLRCYCHLQIAKAYYHSKKYMSSIQSLTELTAQCKDSHYQVETHVLLGKNYYLLNVPNTAIVHFQKAADIDTSGVSSIFMTLFDLDKLNWDVATKNLSDVENTFSGKPLGELARSVRRDISGVHPVHKSPFLAASLSAIIPGSGQFYANHYYDGLQALLFVGSFTYASYLAYKYDSKFSTKYVRTGLAISITSLFYLANIIGAKRTAAYRNHRAKEDVLQPIRKKIFEIDEFDN